MNISPFIKPFLILSLIFVSYSASWSQVIVQDKPEIPKSKFTRPLRLKAGMTWVTGHWKWDKKEKKYFWEEGSWKRPPGKKTWVEGFWVSVPGGYKWIQGHWKKEPKAH